MLARRALVAAFLFWVGTPAPARADWIVAGYVGNAWTASTTLTVDRGAAGTTTFTDVPFESHSFDSPLYYGYRGGWFRRDGLGIEGEVIHLKVYARPGTLGPDVRRFSI